MSELTVPARQVPISRYRHIANRVHTRHFVLYCVGIYCAYHDVVDFACQLHCVWIPRRIHPWSGYVFLYATTTNTQTRYTFFVPDDAQFNDIRRPILC